MNARTLLALVLALAAVPFVGGAYAAWTRPAERADVLASAPWLADDLALAHAARRGEFPGWDPSSAAGVPLAANASSGAWYLPRAARAFCDPVRAEPWLSALALGLAGAGVFALARRRGAARQLACTLAIVAQAVAGFAARGRAPEHLDAALWIPWTWWALDGLARGSRASGPALAVALGLAFTAGNTPVAGVALAAALAYALVHAAWPGSRRAPKSAPNSRAGFLVRAGAWSACGLALGAVQWLPAWSASERPLPPPFDAARLAGLRASQPPVEHDAGLDALFAAIRETAGDGCAAVLARDESAAAFASPAVLRAHGVHALATRAPFAPRAVDELLVRIDPAGASPRGVFLSHASLVNHVALDLLRVTCVVAREPVDHSRLTLVHASHGVFVYARSTSLAAARVVPAELVRPSGTAAVLGLFAASGLDPRRAAVADAALDVPRAETRAPFTPGEVFVTRPAADRLDAEVRGGAGGWLVFHAAWSPGWKAVVNGADEPVVRVDAFCRAVRVPPGDARVRTKYEPAEFRVAAWITLTALAACAFGASSRRARAP